MPEIPGLVGGSNLLRSSFANHERSINCRPERATPGVPKSPSWLGNTPGLRHVTTVHADPVDPVGHAIETLFVVLERVFGVSQTIFFELNKDESITEWGEVEHDGLNLATMASGGTASDSVLIVAGSKGYVFKLSTNEFSEIDDPDFPENPAMCEFFGGYFLVLHRGSRTVSWSDLENPTNWLETDFFSVSWSADPIVFMKRVGTHIWLVGQTTAQIWYATGDINVFAPAQETLIEHGCIAPHSGQRIGENTLIWLDRNEQGGGLVVVASGITPDTISTYAVAWRQEEIAELTSLLDRTVGVPMQIAGHVDYVMLNRANEAIAYTTPVFDFQEGLWHERATWNAVKHRWEQWRIGCHCYAFQRHYGGDYRCGGIYQISTGYDNEDIVQDAKLLEVA